MVRPEASIQSRFVSAETTPHLRCLLFFQSDQIIPIERIGQITESSRSFVKLGKRAKDCVWDEAAVSGGLTKGLLTSGNDIRVLASDVVELSGYGRKPNDGFLQAAL
jgi:hypothetical protein